MISLVQRVANLIVKELAKDGERIILKASKTNETTMGSGNMQDAYGCAVYFRSRLVETRYVNPNPISDKPHKGWKKRGIPADTGRGYLEDFFSKYRPTSDGFAMICVNVIYYTPILEEGKQGGQMPRKYRIISQIDRDFAELSSKYKGSKISNVNGL